MRRPIFFAITVLWALSGCATTRVNNAEKPTEWILEEVGKGIKVGSAASSAGVFAPIIFGAGFIIEKIGGATKADNKHDFMYDSPQESDATTELPN